MRCAFIKKPMAWIMTQAQRFLWRFLLCHASVNIFQKRLDRIGVIGLTVVFIKIICVDGCFSLSNSSQVFLPRPL